MIKPRTTLAIILTVVLCVVAPHIFILINSYWVLLLIPTIQALGFEAKFGVVLTIGVMNSLGALVAAAVVCIPFGWVVRERALLYGGIVGVAASLFFFYTVFVFVPPPDEYWPPRVVSTVFSVSMRVVESLSFIIGCMFFTHIGSRLVRRNLKLR